MNARTSVTGDTSITPDNRPTSAVIIVVIVHTLLVELLTDSGGRCWQWRFNGRVQLLMNLLLLLLVMLLMLLLLLLLVDEMLLLLLLNDGSRCGRGHGQQTLPVVANDLPLVLRILVRRPGHVAVAQGRWRRRMARTSGVAAAAVAVTVVAAVMVVAVVVVVVVRRMLLVAAATVTLILDLGEEKVLLVAVLFRFAGAQMCVSDVGRNLRTGRVDDTTTLPGAFVDRLAGPSLPWQILVVVHADALVRVGERGRPGTANHNLIGGTIVVVAVTVTVTVTFANSVSIALVVVVAVVVIASVVAVVVVRWCGMSILAERR